ncbi:Hypothetical protein FKW44_012828 [Caligus rogercresseyi]|uniref:Uncharacterized protein n=1 Tax=Caligus rogercresseyi TaxID=217165 RepID=A0A7T8HKA2_CALRO|nr:Hypothetical protein FKW44_012828 [Caligus rogercresseyi]
MDIIVKNIRVELEETTNTYEDVVTRRKGKRRLDSLRTPDFLAKLQKKLKDRITDVFNKSPREQIKLICTRFRPRLEKVVQIECAYFE